MGHCCHQVYQHVANCRYYSFCYGGIFEGYSVAVTQAGQIVYLFNQQDDSPSVTDSAQAVPAVFH
ncbi:hypothetical protein XBP1_2070034 [Xenorhabdus bovienii str. puntauvense]|uniref:Uncharacterized protein n=4 Tax=Xenorhabdus bovienii TaxID=40576 RepID=A0A0B6X1N2_XENBV|nr:hypothetical protein XBFFR1_2180034 [Xenorhabdus bovienii str. feltiae France]CDG92706.1 hypothetical protein XBFFL1_2280034 [Xenorhabdus bovienii str. feltiae Florida]CDG96378.1 hypothetical protein XBP1_2070034 [Xenorhabdus bovienii str. puntauvense]CDH00451.1 hypothetical protein XBFM1_1660016 [Xenorhabdus bovienii str. feltiae Moldova]CDH24494.1 hypothetical protein XBKB1_2910013 [Xenorhabdus bovienii str. kraussei Becker Underwood]CDM87375.1 protein of unknown function [Xenorhabdus bov